VGLKYFYFYFFIFQLVGLFLFFTKQSQKKWTPTSLIVLANPAGLIPASDCDPTDKTSNYVDLFLHLPRQMR
jgi:hypothetical protein